MLVHIELRIGSREQYINCLWLVPVVLMISHTLHFPLRNVSANCRAAELPLFIGGAAHLVATLFARGGA